MDEQHCYVTLAVPPYTYNEYPDRTPQTLEGFVMRSDSTVRKSGDPGEVTTKRMEQYAERETREAAIRYLQEQGVSIPVAKEAVERGTVELEWV
jgi:hypothetical protein